MARGLAEAGDDGKMPGNASRLGRATTPPSSPRNGFAVGARGRREATLEGPPQALAADPSRLAALRRAPQDDGGVCGGAGGMLGRVRQAPALRPAISQYTTPATMPAPVMISRWRRTMPSKRMVAGSNGTRPR